MANRFFTYAGNKVRFSTRFNTLSLGVDSSVYVEPFLGSGAIFVNLEDRFDEYIINDLNPYIMDIWRACEHFTYKELLDFRKFIFDKFGGDNTQRSMFELREYYNENIHHVDSVDRGLYLYVLSNACFNGLVKITEKGFCQGFSTRENMYLTPEHVWNSIRNKLKKTTMSSVDYRVLLDGCKDSLIFMDPPYINRDLDYNEHFGTYDDFLKTLTTLSENNNNIVYTDAGDTFKEPWNSFVIRMMTSTASGRSHSGNIRGPKVEMCYFNFEEENGCFQY